MKLRILVIEDNLANLELITYLLKAFGYLPLTACSGAAGMKLVRSDPPDLILCDIGMSEMDGYQVAHQIKTDPELKHIPLVAVTAYAMVGEHERILAAGFEGYFTKPIDPEIFVEQVEAFLTPGKTPSLLSLPTHTLPVTLSDCPVPPDAPPADRANILVLDNLNSNLILARNILEPHGYDISTANTVHQALMLAQERPPNLFLSDIHLPHESGYDFLRAVKADPALQHIPFIFLSSTLPSSADRAQAYGRMVGADRVLVRPIEVEQLIAEIEACLQIGKTNGSEE